MQKISKKIAILISIFCLALTAAFFCACGDDKDEPTATYTVKVVYPDDDETPVPNVELTFCDEADETKTQTPVLTDENGLAVVTYKEANYRVKVTGGLPEGYSLFNNDSDYYCTRTWGSKLARVITLDKTGRNYTVTVAKQGGAKVADAEVVFTPDSDSAETLTRKTDENGEVKILLPAEINYLVTVNPPEGLAVETSKLDGVSTANGDSISFTLFEGQNYSFQVTGPAGVDLEGINVSYAVTANGARQSWGFTDKNGKLSIIKSSSSGYAFITAPEGYAYNENYGNKSPYLLKKDTINFELLKRTDFSLDENKIMDASAQRAFALATSTEANGANDTIKLKNSNFHTLMSEEGRTAYSFNAQIDAGETQVFSFTAKEAGAYSVFMNFSNCEITSYTSLNFSDPFSTLPDKTMSLNFDAEANETYFFTVAGKKENNIQFVVVTPATTNEYAAEGVGDYTITIQKSLPAMLNFRPTEAGEYTVSIQNGESGYRIQQFNQVTLAPMIGTQSDNGTFVITATNSELFDAQNEPTPTLWIFCFTSTAAEPEYPIQITVSITRTGDAIEKEKVIEHAVVQETLTQYAEQTGKLTQIGVNGAQVVKGNDGFYHYGNENGPVVVIKLKGKIDTFYTQDFEDFSTLDQSGNSYYTFYKNSDDTKVYYVSYGRFLRGYDTYASTTIEVEEYYLKYVNKDGVYPLNDELKVFLEYVAAYNRDWLMGCAGKTAQQNCLWLFSAYYYDTTATTAILDIDLTVPKKEN